MTLAAVGVLVFVGVLEESEVPSLEGDFSLEVF